MCRTQCVLALLALYVGFAHSFSWDIVLSKVGRPSSGNGLEFYNNGVLTHSAMPSPRYISWMTYDPVHNRVIFANRFNKNISASSYDVATETTQSFIRKSPNHNLKKFAYDPVTELLFGTIKNSIYSFSLKSGSDNVDGSLVITLDKDQWPRDIAVDSCGGYIFWITKSYTVERALFNGTERELVIDSNNVIRQSLSIDTQKMYWIESQEYSDLEFSIQSADLNGNRLRRTLYSEKENSVPEHLTVSKDFIYWADSIETYFWQFPKNPTPDIDVKPTQVLVLNTTLWGIQHMAANYKIEDQSQGTQNCEAINSLLAINSRNENLLCVHGTKVKGKSLCKCAQGYTGERCDVSVCQNHCFEGNCSVSAEGQPKCRCIAGYSGVRCEVSACQKYCLHNGVCSLNKTSDPVCKCTGGYGGERCDVSVCQNYCFQGDCSVSAEGQPKCRCNAGYSGDRCKANACYKHCLNNGFCSLNETSEPVCQCTGDYVGERCEFPGFLVKCSQTISSLKDFLKADVTQIALDKGLNITCASTVV